MNWSLKCLLYDIANVLGIAISVSPIINGNFERKSKGIDGWKFELKHLNAENAVVNRYTLRGTRMLKKNVIYKAYKCKNMKEIH